MALCARLDRSDKLWEKRLRSKADELLPTYHLGGSR